MTRRTGKDDLANLWAEAVRLLPDGWFLDLIHRDGMYEAWAMQGPDDEDHGKGVWDAETAEDALRGLLDLLEGQRRSR